MKTSEPPADAGWQVYHNDDAQERVLSAVLINPALAKDRGFTELPPEAFTRQRNQRAFKAIRAINERGELVSAAAVLEEISRNGGRGDTGAAGALGELVDLAAGTFEFNAGLASLRRQVPRNRIAEAATEALEACSAGTDPLAVAARLGAAAQLVVEAGAPPVELVDLETARAGGIPAVEWLFEGCLPRVSLSILAGWAGCGKSTLAAHLACAVATGRDWIGIAPEHCGPVLVIDNEQSRPGALRLYLRAFGDMPVDRLALSVGSGLTLNRPGDVAALERAIAERRPRLVIFDSAAACFGCDLKRDEECGPVYSTLKRWRDRYELAIVVIAHSPKSQGGFERPTLERVFGSQIHVSQADAVFVAERLADGALRISQPKNREAAPTCWRVGIEHAPDRSAVSLLDAVPEEVSGMQTASGAIIEKLAGGGRCRTADLKQAAMAKGCSGPTAERAIAGLKASGAIRQAGRRGVYQLSNGYQQETPGAHTDADA